MSIDSNCLPRISLNMEVLFKTGFAFSSCPAVILAAALFALILRPLWSSLFFSLKSMRLLKVHSALLYPILGHSILVLLLSLLLFVLLRKKKKSLGMFVLSSSSISTDLNSEWLYHWTILLKLVLHNLSNVVEYTSKWWYLHKCWDKNPGSRGQSLAQLLSGFWKMHNLFSM